MEKIVVSSGVFWVEVPEANLRILCGCPADSVKHLMNKGLIVSEEREGVRCETGPNAILLSEAFLQGGHFSNLAEFPILQMLYRQGFIVPDHPNNNGQKPILIGRKESIEAQSQYIYRGNYGLVSKEELLEAGVSEDMADTMMRFKLKFAFDNIRSTDELIDTRVVDEAPVEIIGGVKIRRVDFNVYEISYNGETLKVDLNLEEGEEYEPPYTLGHYKINRDYFAILHTGEGDGWDKDRPCMGSIITFQGKIYMVDAGPNLLHSLRALGIGVAEIEGIFHTHAHDDHFNGLTSLMGSDHRIKYYASPAVRASTMKKFAALLSTEEEQFYNYFEIHDLKDGEWNDIEGLEVRPVVSPHPVETSILFFRTLWGEGYQSYAHLADIASYKVLEGMVEDDTEKSGVTREYFEKVRKEYMTPATIKKIDVGGGMIHGDAIDFSRDESDKVLLSHTSGELTDAEREIGSSASFGISDVLITSTQDYGKQRAYQHFQDYFPTVPKHNLQMLLNSPTAKFNPGSIMIKKDELPNSVYFMLSGIMEFVSTDYRINNKLSVGSLAGELSAIEAKPPRGTYRAISHVKALKIPRKLYVEFLNRNNILDIAKSNMEKRRFLQMTWLIGEKISCPLKNRIARRMIKETVPSGWTTTKESNKDLYMLVDGKVELITTGNVVANLKHGDFFGEENIIGKTKRLQAHAIEDSTIWKIPNEAFAGIPIIHWKLIEAHEKRMKKVIEMGSSS